jgi:hypothetical protein
MLVGICVFFAIIPLAYSNGAFFDTSTLGTSPTALTLYSAPACERSSLASDLEPGNVRLDKKSQGTLIIEGESTPSATPSPAPSGVSTVPPFQPYSGSTSFSSNAATYIIVLVIVGTCIVAGVSAILFVAYRRYKLERMVQAETEAVVIQMATVDSAVAHPMSMGSITLVGVPVESKANAS